MTLLPPLHVLDYEPERYNVPDAWKTTKGAGVSVFVLDTGVPKGFEGTGEEDRNGHATAVCGLVRKVAPDASIFAVQVMDANGLGSTGKIREGLDYCIKHKPRVVVLSLGANFDLGVRDLIKRLSETCIVCAAGNDGNAVDYPAAYPECFAVGAVNEKGEKGKFSSVGREIDFVADGVGVEVPTLSGGMEKANGTSFAAPIFAGVVALLLAAHPKLTPKDVRAVLARHTVDLGEKGRDEAFGFGLVQVPDLDDLGPVVPLPPEKEEKKGFWARVLRTLFS